VATAGALKLAQGFIRGENFLVLNDDSFVDLDLNILNRVSSSPESCSDYSTG